MKRRKDSQGKVLETGESQRKDGIYSFRYVGLDGKRKYIYDSNLSSLREKKRQILRDLDDGIECFEDITLNQQFDRYLILKNTLSHSTKSNYMDLWKNHVRNTPLGRTKIDSIKKSHILTFYNKLHNKGLKYATLKVFQCILNPLFELALEDDIIRKNPCKGALKGFSKDATEKMALTKEEQKILLCFLQEDNIYQMYYPMIVFMLETGLRCGELIGLTWNDVDFRNNYVNIDHQLLYRKRDGKFSLFVGEPKTKAGFRKIPLTKSANNALKEQRQLQLELGRRTNCVIDGYKDFCFSTKHQNPFMPSSINNILENIVKSYNRQEEALAKSEKRTPILLPHISAHTLRHTACTRMAECGIDIKVLQSIMGHSDIAITMNVYNHASYEREQQEIMRLEMLKYQFV